MPLRVSTRTHFASLISLCALALAAAGCGIQQSKSERPNWSLNGPDRLVPAPQPAKRYGNWNGANAPKPLTYDGKQ